MKTLEIRRFLLNTALSNGGRSAGAGDRRLSRGVASAVPVSTPRLKPPLAHFSRPLALLSAQRHDWRAIALVGGVGLMSNSGLSPNADPAQRIALSARGSVCLVLAFFAFLPAFKGTLLRSLRTEAGWRQEGRLQFGCFEQRLWFGERASRALEIANGKEDMHQQLGHGGRLRKQNIWRPRNLPPS